MNEAIDTFHELLVQGADFAACQQQVYRFFEQTLLLRYDRLRVVAERSLPATAAAFRPRVEAGIAANRQVLAQMLQELREAGVNSLEEVSGLPTGYQSKVLHIVAHFLDGFIGIDSRFYNLADDSHWLTAEGWRKIETAPHLYWLIYLEASSPSAASAALVHL